MWLLSPENSVARLAPRGDAVNRGRITLAPGPFSPLTALGRMVPSIGRGNREPNAT